MTQRLKRHISDIIDVRNAKQRYPADAQALERIKFDVSEWDQLNWYVSLIRKDLRQLSAGDILNLQEEYRALERTLFADVLAIPLPTLEAIESTQRDIAKHLQQLVDKESVLIGPFKISMFVSRPKDWAQKVGFKSLIERSNDLLFQTGLREGDGLVFHMGQLLKNFGASLRRCPHCQNIFLKARRNQNHCDRVCQSRAAMNAIRKRRKEKKFKSVAPTKGVRHGKARR